jgi:hypothetical protein
MTEQRKFEAGGDRLKRQIKEGKAAAEAERLSERMASIPNNSKGQNQHQKLP